MSPKPATRRRSTVASASKNDTSSQDDASVQEEPDTVRTLSKRRSVRKSFADVPEDGAISNPPSKLTSIEEDSQTIPIEESKPVTRRTRASMASLRTPFEPEPELCLPTTRRTRRSSLSSVSSSIVASPKRQTRSRKNLSPVASPTVSEVSTVSEVPETSPASKSSPSKDKSPMTSKSPKLLGSPRQLELNDSDSAKTKRQSFVSDNVQGEESGSPELERSLSRRRSSGRQSLKSLNFVESAMEDPEKSNPDDEKPSNDNEGNSEIELDKSKGSIGRWSLSSNKPSRLSLSSSKSSRLSLSSNKSSPSPLSPALLQKFESSPHVTMNGSQRSSIGRLSLSSKKASPEVHLSEFEGVTNSETSSPRVMITKLRKEEGDHTDYPKQISTHSQRESTGRITRKSSPFNFEVSTRLSPNKSQVETLVSEDIASSSHETSEEVASVPFEQKELNNSRRSSIKKISMGKSPSSKFQELENITNEDSSTTDKASTEQEVFDVEDSSTDPGSVELVLDKSNSVCRPMSSSKAGAGYHQTPDGSPKLSTFEAKSRFSLSSNKSTPAKSPKLDNSEVSNTDSQKPSLNRFSLSSMKSTPAKSPKGEVAPQEDVVTPNTILSRFSASSNKLSPSKSPKCDSSLLTSDNPPNTLLSRFSVSFNKSINSTPGKPSPGKSPGKLSLSAKKSPHSVDIQGDDSEHSENEESVPSSDASGQMENLNLSRKAEEPSPRKSTGRSSLTPSLSLKNSHHQEEGASSDEESDAISSSDPPEQDVSLGRGSLTPSMSLNYSHHEEEESSDDASGSEKEASNDSCDKAENLGSVFVSNRSEGSRRASTGNLSTKPLKTDLKKARASMGHLNQPFSWLSEEKDDASDSSVDGGDKHDFAAGELTLSPIKQDVPPKKMNRTPSSDKSASEPERQNSPNNPFEKSTVFNDDSFASNTETSEQALEMSLGKSSTLNTSRNDEENASDANNQLGKGATELDLQKGLPEDVSTEEKTLVSRKSLNVGKKLGSTGILQAAALLMSGGNISDFDADSSDDDQWQPVLPQPTMSRKEKKLERKARKKAEKEARKKLERERSLKGTVADLKTKNVLPSSDNEDCQNPVSEENILPMSDSRSPAKSKKRKSMDANLGSSQISNEHNEEFDSSENTSSKRQKTLSQSEIDSPLVEESNFTCAPAKSDEDLTEENGQDETERKKKKKKNVKAITATGVESATDIPTVKNKKKKLKNKVVEDGASVIHEHSEGENLNTPPVADNGDGETEHKKKKKKAKASTSAEVQTAVEKASSEIKKKKLKKSVLEENPSVEELSVKKKKQQKFTSENKLEENSAAILKIKKKNKNLVLQPFLALEHNSNDVPDKKKSKKVKLSVDETKDKKSNKKVIFDGDEAEAILKKPKKMNDKLIPEQSKDEKQSKKMKKKKIKEKSVLESNIVTADDSDDEPTSVSFTAGRSAALAMMEAAAENIKRQKELKKQKMRERQEKSVTQKSSKVIIIIII